MSTVSLSAPTSIRFDADVMELIKQRAKEEHRSVSNYVRKAMADLLRPQETDSTEAILQMVAQAEEEYKNGESIVCETWEDTRKLLDSL